MTIDYIRQPKTINQLASQVVKICDDYWDGLISETFLRDYLEYTAKNAGLVEGNDLNITVNIKIGKRRTRLVKAILGLN